MVCKHKIQSNAGRFDFVNLCMNLLEEMHELQQNYDNYERTNNSNSIKRKTK